MALPFGGLNQFQIPVSKPSSSRSPIGSTRAGQNPNPNPFPPARASAAAATRKRCLRCGTRYTDPENSPTACSFHGHTTGERGLFASAPPHQGIDGEWSDKSGVIVYKWNEKTNRPNTGSRNWKKRWSCCAEYDENAPPCQHGCHVSYDDGFTLY